MRNRSFSERDIAEIVPLLGEKAQPIHMPIGNPQGVGGGDVDCLVWELDHAWPLRLPPPWRLLQVLQYDVVGWCWIIERGGGALAIDALSDPDGIGKYVWPVTEDSIPLDPGQRAGYLTAKRLYKGITSESEWFRIQALAKEDPTLFVRSLDGPFGRMAQTIAASVLEAGHPGRVWDQARKTLKRRRYRNPSRILRIAAAQVARVVRRLRRPTGLTVLIVGPDGSGKTAVAQALSESCAAMFRGMNPRHWRPGLLPRATDLGGSERDSTAPHAGRPRRRLTSLAMAGYHWLDFFVAGVTTDRLRRARTTLMVAERGWIDLSVDPTRYRLNIPASVVRFADRFLPKPDLAVVLRPSPEVAMSRKAELTQRETARQSECWRQHPPRAGQVIEIDADQSLDVVVTEIRSTIMDLLNRRALAQVGGGWAALPRRNNVRWWLPRRPRAATSGGLHVYQPVTTAGRMGWKATKVLSRAGAFRAAPIGAAIPDRVRAMIASYIPAGGRVSVMRANHPNRFVALVLDRSGVPAVLAKVALDEAGADALTREGLHIGALAASLDEPLRGPVLLGTSPGVLAIEGVPWVPRRDPWRLNPDVARALGSWFASGRNSDEGGPAHGDFAPWNLLLTKEGWLLVDWEAASALGEPFHDLFHYFVQGHALLGRPSARDLLDGIGGEGEIGAAFGAFAEEARISLNRMDERIAKYLRDSMEPLNPERVDGAAGIAARSSLLHSLGASSEGSATSSKPA